MNDQLPIRGLWSSRAALFSLLLILTSLFLHRIFYLPTPTLFLCLGFGYILAVFALIVGIVAGVGIWQNRAQGAARVFLGCCVGCGIGIIPLLLFLHAKNFPFINDVTTNTSDPPLFKVLGQERTSGAANPSVYPFSHFASQQYEAYPDLISLKINRSLQDTFDLVVDTLRRLQMRIVSIEAPSETSPEGRIEAVNRTLVVGFYNDLSLRVRGTPTTAVIDLRSSSRYGKSDFGYNAQLIRSVMRELLIKLGTGGASTSVESSEPRQPPLPAKQQKNGSPKKGEADR